MKVKDLIKILKGMPQGAEVNLEIITFNGSVTVEPEEIYESVNDNVVIQGYAI